MSYNSENTANNGAVLKIAHIIKTVMSSAVKEDFGALYINFLENVPDRHKLEEMVHK